MKNFHKLSAAATLALILGTTPSSANNAFFKSGLTAGGDIGYSKMMGRFTNDSQKTTTAGVVTFITSSATHKNFNASSIIGSIFGGYRHITESGFAIGFNIGVSIDGSSVKDSGKINTVTFSTKLNRQFQITPALFIGQRIAERWMIFTELGLSVSRFKLKSTRTLNNITASHNKSFTKVGFAPAIGTEYAINKNLAVMGKLTYEIFGSTKKDVGSTTRTVGITTNKTANDVKVKPHYFTAKVGMLYKF